MRALKVKDISVEATPEGEDSIATMQAYSDTRLAMLGSLADGLSHELNSPLQILTDGYKLLMEMNQTLLELLERSGAGELLGETELEDLQFLQSQVQPAEHRVRAGLGRVREVVDTVQLFAGRSNGAAKEDLRFLPALRVALEPFAESPVEIRVSVQGDPSLFAAQEDVNTVVRELVNNAIEATMGQATSSRRPVVIRAKVIDAALVLEVQDEGAGIPESLQTRIFEPYFSSHPDGKHRGRGLSIVEQLIRTKYHGVIVAQSIPDERTVIRVELPLRA